MAERIKNKWIPFKGSGGVFRNTRKGARFGIKHVFSSAVIYYPDYRSWDNDINGKVYKRKNKR